jgi:hypothetical protein
MYTRAVPHHKFPKEDLVQKFYQGLTMASRTIIDASARGSIIELTPTEAFTLFKKVADNDTLASSGRLLPVQPTGNIKGVLQVEKEDILEGKIDSLMQRLEKMEIEKKEAQDLKAAKARSTCEDCKEYGHVHKDCPEEVLTQNQHLAPSTRQAERSWLNTRDGSRSVPVNFPETDKGIKIVR